MLVMRAYLEFGPTVGVGGGGELAEEGEDVIDGVGADAGKRKQGGNKGNEGSASPVLSKEKRRLMEQLVETIASLDNNSDADDDVESRFLYLLVQPPVNYETLSIDDAPTTTSSSTNINPKALSILQSLEQLLPDPIEEEEAHKGAWDLVMDLYGRESVRVNEEALQRSREGGDGVGEWSMENMQWRTLCCLGRILIHYDFLTKGLLEEGAFR